MVAHCKMQRVVVQGMKAVVVVSEYGPNQVLRRLQGRTYEVASKNSICVAPGMHVVDRFGMYVNHSCTPNTRVETGYLVTNRDINPGAEVTIDYRKTEKLLFAPFKCLRCRGQMTGEDSICVRDMSQGAGFNPPI